MVPRHLTARLWRTLPAALPACVFALLLQPAVRSNDALAAPLPVDGDSPAAFGWETIPIEGATCGRGAPFKYFLNESDDPAAGMFIFLMGGGACLKVGPPPAGASGAAAQLYCMEFPNFTEPTDLYHGVSAVFPFLNRNRADNPYRAFHFAFIPYCTGDLHAGTRSDALDYDPAPGQEFPVWHRGRLNVLSVLDDLQRRYPDDREVVLTGSSAGGLGAILNYPEVAARWPSTVLLPDAGIAPATPGSLLDLHGADAADRWGAEAVLPEYCSEPDCLTDSLMLLASHAQHWNGVEAPWRPFGYLQGERDTTLAAWFEVLPCTYQMALQSSVKRNRSPNMRGYLPATEQHTFLGSNAGFVTMGGVQMLEWFAQVTAARSEAQLPPEAVDPWPACNPIALPMAFRR